MQEVRITPAEIRAIWDRALDGEFPFSERQMPALGSCVNRWREPAGSRGADWQGAAGSEVQSMLANGVPASEGAAPDLTMGDQTIGNSTIELFEEDGDLIIEAALNGDDLLYARWDLEEVKRGLTVRFHASFNCGTKAHSLRDYYAWILRIVDAAALRGIAPSVEIVYEVTNMTDRQGLTRILIPVVEAGELVDASAWRAFVHGASFRTLGFAAIGIAADKLSETVRVGLGSSRAKQWGVEFADDVLTLLAPGNATDFPEQKMTEQVDAALGTLV